MIGMDYSFDDANLNFDNVNLDCDIDDVLIPSSHYIQSYVESSTVFKSEKLCAIEQLKRNCQFYASCITNECERAFKEGRTPNLSFFPNMTIDFPENKKIDVNTLSDEDKKRIYINPINSANYYLWIANRIMDEFFEERDMFLELDNLPYGNTKKYDFAKEKKEIEHFKETIRDNYKAIQNIDNFCLESAKKIIANSQNNGSVPKFGDLVKMDDNDIIRVDAKDQNQQYLLYEKPLKDISSCIKPSILDYALDNFDIHNTYSKEIVKYDKIYTVDNVDHEAVAAIRRLMRSGKINKLRFVTHHNGLREATAKRNLIKKLFPEAEFIGMRFHSEEHNLKRRKRSSKIDGVREAVIDFNPRVEILLDDSKDNCNDWHDKKGLVILFRRLTSAEKATGMEEFEYHRITSFDELDGAVGEIISQRKQKIKKLEVR